MQALFRRAPLLIGVCIAAGSIGFATLFTVGFDEVAVRTTFGGAGQGDVITEPGLHFRVPVVQRVIRYDTRIQIIETRLETLQTRDKKQINVETFMTWKVADPLQFYRRFGGAGDEQGHYREAERLLVARLRSATVQAGAYRFDELFGQPDGAGDTALQRLEKGVRDRLVADIQNDAKEAVLAEFGVEIGLVGISAVGLPEETARAVFGRMKEARAAEASSVTSSGEAQAEAIRSRADAEAGVIYAFVEELAATYRSEGEKEALGYIKVLNEEPELAIFQSKINMLRDTVGDRTTIVLPTDSVMFDVFSPAFANRFGNRDQQPAGGQPK